jgi:actin-related protein
VNYGNSKNSEPFQYISDNELFDIEKTLKSVIFEQSKNSSDELPFFYIEEFDLNKNKRELVSEVLFETYNIPSLIYGFSPILSGFYSYIKHDINSLEITALIVEISNFNVKVSPIVRNRII